MSWVRIPRSFPSKIGNLLGIEPWKKICNLLGNELPRVGFEPTTLCTPDRMLYCLGCIVLLCLVVCMTLLASFFLSCPAAPPSYSCTNAQDLFALLKSTPDDVIVLDCRPRSMFLASHPDGKKYPQWLSVPEEIITRG